MKFRITLTWSKIMALVVIILATVLDIQVTESASTFMYALPFVVFLITGKQVNDRLKGKTE